MLLLGIDDAGRGPLIGPMILCGVLIDKSEEQELKKLGAKDSKLLSHTQRIQLSKLIKGKTISHKIVKSFPEEIDEFVLSGTNLNTLEAKKAAEIINSLNDIKKQMIVVIDCPSINTSSWREKLISFINYDKNLEIICEHKADFNHPIVSAASIIAKVEREEEVDKIKKVYGDIGSGYPSDPKTKEFLKNKGQELKDSGIFRKSWATWKTMFPESNQKKGQRKLGEF